MKVYIEFTRPKSFSIISLLVRLVERTPYSHVRLRWSPFPDMDLVYEANGCNVRLLGTQAQAQQEVEVIRSYEVELSQLELSRAYRLARYAGVSYGFLQIVGILLIYLFKLKRNPFADGAFSQICSELVGRFIEEVKGWSISPGLEIAGPRAIDNQLSKLCQEHPNEIRKL